MYSISALLPSCYTKIQTHIMQQEKIHIVIFRVMAPWYNLAGGYHHFGAHPSSKLKGWMLYALPKFSNYLPDYT
jgi:hypothetical protein